VADTYPINEIFYSLQGEGVRAGTAAVFVRFSGCNLSCNMRDHGFDCDTKDVRRYDLTSDQMLRQITVVMQRHYNPPPGWLIWTGGEASLYLDSPLVRKLWSVGYKQAIETNGTKAIPQDVERHLDWISVSPKTPPSTIKVRRANEIRVVMGPESDLPTRYLDVLSADYYCLSPRFIGSVMDADALDHCIDLCARNPAWRLSIQQHKVWGVR
jgi:organic radical activating enzyme